MAQRGCRGGERFVSMGKVHECEEATCEAQLMECFQRLEEWLDRFGFQFERFGDHIVAQLVR